MYNIMLIALAAILATVGLARRGSGRGRRKFRRYLRGNIDHKLALGTLGAGVVLKSNIADTVVDTTWLSSVRGTWSLEQYTKAIDDGPILVGICHSDYTGSEVEEWVENLSNWDQGDLIAQEIGRRKIRLVGMFSVPASAEEVSVLNDGKQMTTKAGWLLSEGDTVSVWAYNSGESALATTDPGVRLQGHANLWPK